MHVWSWGLPRIFCGLAGRYAMLTADNASVYTQNRLVNDWLLAPMVFEPMSFGWQVFLNIQCETAGLR